MAHSHHHHREHQVSHRRVAHILKDEPHGASEHSESHAFSKVTSKSAAEHHNVKHTGHKGAKRYARGGKVKHGGKDKGHQTNIAIVMPHSKAGASPTGPMAGAPPGGPPPMPLGAPGPGGPGGPGGPPGMPPGMPPGGPGGGPPGMPPGMPHKRGGKVIEGISTKENIKEWGKRTKGNSFFRGGAATGVGREEKAHKAGRKK